MYILVPLILAAATRVTSLWFYSPFGFFFHLFDPSEGPGTTVKVSVLVVNALLCVVPAVLVARRYASIRLLRQSMAGGPHGDSVQRPG